MSDFDDLEEIYEQHRPGVNEPGKVTRKQREARNKMIDRLVESQRSAKKQQERAMDRRRPLVFRENQD